MAYFAGRLENDLGQRSVWRGFLSMFENVFTDHDTHVHHGTDGNGDTGESDNIGSNIEPFHGAKAH